MPSFEHTYTNRPVCYVWPPTDEEVQQAIAERVRRHRPIFFGGRAMFSLGPWANSLVAFASGHTIKAEADACGKEGLQ